MKQDSLITHVHGANGTEIFHLTIPEWAAVVTIVGGIMAIIWKVTHWQVKKIRHTHAEYLKKKSSK